MGVTRFGVNGFSGVDRQLAELTRRLSVKEKRDALRAGAAVIAEEARRLAPRRTGALAKSIKVVAGSDKRVAGGLDLDGVSVLIGPVGAGDPDTAFYAGFVENGTSRTAAQPYMRPAVDAKRAEAEAVVVAQLAAAVARKA